MENIIFHFDVNSAFLSWEAVYRLFHRGGTLDLREIPSAVGRDISLHHGIILAKSIPAKDTPAPNKGYGNSTTLSRDMTDREEVDRVLLALSETVAARLRADHVQAEVVSVGIKYNDLSCVSHQKVLGASTDLTVEICQAARELFAELWDHRPIRLLGVHTSRVRRDDFSRQMSLFDEVDYGKLAEMDRTVDAIRERFGMDAVMRAAFLNQPIDHMSGGNFKRKKRG